MYKNGRVDSVWCSTLPKIRISSFLYEIQFHTTFIKAFFDVMRIFGSMEPQTVSTFPSFYIIILQIWESFEPPSSTLRGDRHMRSRTFFVRKFNFEQLLFKAFFDLTRIFGSVKHQTGPTFPFLYIIIFQRGESFEPPSSTLRGEIDIFARELFCMKFNFEQLLFKAFLMQFVFLAVSNTKMNLVTHFCTYHSIVITALKPVMSRRYINWHPLFVYIRVSTP